MQIVALLLDLYRYAVLAWVILSWVQVSSVHPLARVTTFLDRIIYPVILPLRRIIPPLRIGGALLDLSPIVLLILISLVRGLLV